MQKGFSLVELSIVLVILGLLTGGILAGQNLIRAAEVRSVITQANTILTSSYTFRDKYFAIPGDMHNATKFWGQHSVCGGGDVSGTCDGNGDGSLAQPSAANQSGEDFQFWRQLAKAGLIEGEYTGIAGPGARDDILIGENVPRTKTSGLLNESDYWKVRNFPDYTSGSGAPSGIFYVDYSPNILQSGYVLRTAEAWNMDTKLDDGLPGHGRMIIRRYDTCTTASGPADLTAEYKVQNTNAACSIYFRNLF